jgi:hypothetical protein
MPVHQMSDDDANDTGWPRKLLRNEPGRHWLDPEAISSNVASVDPISVAEFLFEIFFFALYDAEVQNQQARNDEQQQPIEHKHQCDPESAVVGWNGLTLVPSRTSVRLPVAASRTPARIATTPAGIRHVWVAVARSPIGDNHCRTDPRAIVVTRIMGGKTMTLG